MRRAVRSAGPGERPVPEDEETAVADVLAATLAGLGTLDMDDVQAVALGSTALAERLAATAPQAARELSRDAELLHQNLTGTACLRIVHFFSQRSTFVARTLIQQSRSLDALITRVDEFAERRPAPPTGDITFERTYLSHLAHKHGRLTIYGIDLHNSPDRWPLDAAYTSLEATGPSRTEGPFDDLPAKPTSPTSTAGSPSSSRCAPSPAPAPPSPPRTAS